MKMSLDKMQNEIDRTTPATQSVDCQEHGVPLPCAQCEMGALTNGPMSEIPPRFNVNAYRESMAKVTRKKRPRKIIQNEN